MKSRGVRFRPRQLLDALEPRQYLSAWSGAFKLGQASSLVAATPRAHITLKIAKIKKTGASPNASSPPGSAFTPAQIRQAYGMNQITFGSIAGDGSGQTIAIIDAFDDPNAFADLQTFDQQFGLADPPSFQRVNQSGQTSNYPATYDATYNASYGWQLEETLDIEWAHVMAPGASIILVEANSTSYSDLIQGAANWARSQPGVSAVSMSFGSNGEFSGETQYDSYLTTPGTHNGVTFIASTGDSGSPGGYPAYSPNVVAVGGTSLSLNSDGSYGSETGWSGSGGGAGGDESKPAYQANVDLSSSHRSIPDVAFDADPNTGVAVYDSFHNSDWLQVGGTSLASPMFAGLIAVANQGRVIAGLGTLDGPSQTLPKLYAASSADFHDITSGNNGGHSAGPGYDLVTGLGTPVGNLLVSTLVGVVGSISGTVYADNNGNGTFDAGDTPLPGVTVYIDTNNNGILDSGGDQSQSNNTQFSIPDASNAGTTSTLTFANLGGAIASISLTVNITHPRDSNLTAILIGPDGTQITLFSGVGGFFGGPNFTNTTLTDAASVSISSGTAPFTGSFRPTTPLSTFNGESPDGTWTLLVKDTVRKNTGTLDSWSLDITTAGDITTVTGTDGTYTFGSLSAGNYTVREVTPQGFQETSVPSATFNVAGNISGANFTNMPVSFTAAASGESYYLWVSGNNLNISTNGTPADPTYVLPGALLSNLSFNLTAPDSQLIIDYTHGDPVPPEDILLDGAGLATSELVIIAGSAPISMTDTTIGQTDGGVIDYTNLGQITFHNATVHFVGTLENLQDLYIDAGTTFYWDG